MTRYSPAELVALDVRLWLYLAPNSRKWHVYDADGDSLCRRYCVVGGSAIMADGPHTIAEAAELAPLDDADTCKGCRTALHEAAAP